MRFPSSNVSIGVRPLPFFSDGFAHYYSEPAIHQDPTVMYQDRRTVFYGTLPDKIRSGLFYGTASQMPLVCGDIAFVFVCYMSFIAR